MTQSEWPGRITATIASQVRLFRRERKISGQHLATMTAELGMEIPRSVLANFESGRRETVSVAEMLILAYALDVTPAMLLVPSGEAEMLPGVMWPSERALRWLSHRRCTQCEDNPPEGYTCNTCGRAGS
jgi:transcriptional regulator with XRE-family HTH domain